MQICGSSLQTRHFLHRIISTSNFIPNEEVLLALNNFSRIFTPPHLYRYRGCGKEHSFSDIEANQITLTAASEFSDTHDAAVHDMGEMERMANRIVSQSSEARRMTHELMETVGMSLGDETTKRFNAFSDDFFELPTTDRQERVDGITNQMKEAVDPEQYSKSLRSQLQIACLCENPNSSYMWENYGGDGSGYVIEYKTSQLFKIDLENEQLPLILPVIYSDPLPDTFLLPISQIIEPIATSVMEENLFKGMRTINLIKCIFYKQIDPYAQEEEWRLQLTPQKGEEGSKHIFRSVRPSRLIAGPNMEDRDKERLIEYGKANGITVDEAASEKE